MSQHIIPPLSRSGHAAHCNRCLTGLPSSQAEIDSSRLALAFYCLGSLDLLGLLESKTSVADRNNWTNWIWEQQIRDRYGTGFRPSPFMAPKDPKLYGDQSEYDVPHIIMTYTALLSLSILRDDFTKLDRPGLIRFLRSCQRADGSFSSVTRGTESDLRSVYCAFAISNMLNDWSGMNVQQAITYIGRCRTYEGGYGQEPLSEAQGGTTYTALAALHVAPPTAFPMRAGPLTLTEKNQTIRWLIQNQAPSGGFCGRTEKDADACYCFWCGASLQILGAHGLVNSTALASFISKCQFKFGGIAKAPGEHPDPYHTYLSLAALAIYPPDIDDPSWKLDPLDPLLNAKTSTARWAREHIPAHT